MPCLNVSMYVVRYFIFLFFLRHEKGTKRREEKRREEKRREEKCCDEMRRAEQRSIQRRRKGKRIDVKRKAEQGSEETTFGTRACNNNNNRATQQTQQRHKDQTENDLQALSFMHYVPLLRRRYFLSMR